MSDNPFSPRAGINTLVERRFGGAWQKIQDVVENLGSIRKLADNMSAVRQAANNLSRGILVIEKMATGPGTTNFVEWPEALNIDDLLYYTAVIIGTDGTIYSVESNYFTMVLRNGALEIVVSPDAPVVIDNGLIRWVIDYKN